MATEVLQLVAVAFLRQTGGRIGVLFAVDGPDGPQHDGEPVLLVQHRPGAGADQLEVEGADALAPGVVRAVRAQAAAVVAAVEAGLDAFGQVDGTLLLGSTVDLRIT